MDYKKASQIRKKSLLSLIAEKKFEEGEGLGSSIASAFSEKMKAKATGFKEKFDPLNMIKAITGEGVIGKSIRTVAGRAFGRSDKDIEYFGGYGRKGKKGRKKLKNKKNPQFTTISNGPVVMLKSGDSIANILGKMYIFMQKTHERHKISSEIEEAFRTEQLEEDERRHKKVIDAILNKKDKNKPAEDGGAESFIKKLMEGLKSTLGGIVSMIASVGESLLSFVGNLGKIIASVVTEAFGILVAPLIAMFSSTILEMGTKLTELMFELTGKTIAKELVAKKLGMDAVKNIGKNLAKNALSVGGGAAAGAAVVTLGAVSIPFDLAVGAVTALAFTAYEAYQGFNEAEKLYQKSLYGEDYWKSLGKTYDKVNALQAKADFIQQGSNQGRDDPKYIAIKKEIDDIKVKGLQESEKLKKEFQEKTLIPTMAKQDFYPKEGATAGNLGPEDFVKKDKKTKEIIKDDKGNPVQPSLGRTMFTGFVGGSVISPLENKAKEVESDIKNYDYQEKVDKLTSGLKKDIKSVIDASKNYTQTQEVNQAPPLQQEPIDPKRTLKPGEEIVPDTIKGETNAPKASVEVKQAPPLQQEPPSPKNIPPLTDEELIKKSLSPGEQIISSNKTNNFGSRSPRIVNAATTKVRDDSVAPQNNMISVPV